MTKGLDELRTAVTVAKHNEKVSWHRFKEAEARAEVAEGRLSAVGLVVDDLHATGAISQDVADQLTEALDGGDQE